MRACSDARARPRLAEARHAVSSRRVRAAPRASKPGVLLQLRTDAVRAWDLGAILPD
jgi:hypothetical protein